MKPYNETTTNPFLCDDCQQLGYCRKTREDSVEDLLAKHYQYLSVPNKEYHYIKNNDHLSSFLDACERAAREVKENETSISESKQLQKVQMLQTNCNTA